MSTLSRFTLLYIYYIGSQFCQLMFYFLNAFTRLLTNKVCLDLLTIVFVLETIFTISNYALISSHHNINHRTDTHIQMKGSLSVCTINRITVTKAVQLQYFQLQYYYKNNLRLKNCNVLILPAVKRMNERNMYASTIQFRIVIYSQRHRTICEYGAVKMYLIIVGVIITLCHCVNFTGLELHTQSLIDSC